MTIKIFDKLGAIKLENVNKTKSNLKKHTEKGTISTRKSGNNRKCFAFMIKKEVIAKLKWPTDNIRVDLYTTGQGCGFHEHSNGEYALSARRKRNGDITGYEIKIAYNNKICSIEKDFKNIPVDLKYYSEEGKNFLWFDIPHI